MPDKTKLAKAELVQLKRDFTDVDKQANDKTVKVQFNPETLKVTYTNQLQQPEGAGDKRGSPGHLFVGSGTTKLTCTLWFDVTAKPDDADATTKSAKDVRTLTNRVSYFITPAPDSKAKSKKSAKLVPPAVRFTWGSFQFDGIMESVDESLEFFSPEGVPLRASVGISMTQQRIVIVPPKDLGNPDRPKPGTRPTTPVPTRTPVQKLAGENWQDVAQANNVENPRLPPQGQRLDLGGGQ